MGENMKKKNSKTILFYLEIKDATSFFLSFSHFSKTLEYRMWFWAERRKHKEANVSGIDSGTVCRVTLYVDGCVTFFFFLSLSLQVIGW